LSKIKEEPDIIAGHIAVIIFKHFHEHSKLTGVDFVVEPVTDEDNLDLTFGVTYRSLAKYTFKDKPENIKSKLRSMFDKNWDHINLLNFRIIRQRVDTALTVLD
jgi:hypothetical protein